MYVVAPACDFLQFVVGLFLDYGNWFGVPFSPQNTVLIAWLAQIFFVYKVVLFI